MGTETVKFKWKTNRWCKARDERFGNSGLPLKSLRKAVRFGSNLYSGEPHQQLPLSERVGLGMSPERETEERTGIGTASAALPQVLTIQTFTKQKTANYYSISAGLSGLSSIHSKRRHMRRHE